MMVVASREGTLETTPFFDHSRQKLRSIRIERRIEMHGNPQRSRGGHQVALRRVKNGRISEKFVDRHLIPTKNIERVKVINNSQRIDFVQARNYTVILDVGEAADVQNEFGASALRRQFKAGPFHIAISQTEFFADLTETEAGDHVFLRGGKIWLEGDNTI